jgi:hypothetical protein
MKIMVDGRWSGGWFSDVLQIGFQRKGSMVDGRVDSFGKVLHVSKGKSIDHRSIEFQIND